MRNVIVRSPVRTWIVVMKDVTESKMSLPHDITLIATSSLLMRIFVPYLDLLIYLPFGWQNILLKVAKFYNSMKVLPIQ